MLGCLISEGVGSMDKQSLVMRAINGEERAIIELLRVNEALLYRTAYAYLRNEHDAVDAIQELNLRALKKLHTVKEPQHIDSWLVRVLINICLNMKKKQQRMVLTEIPDLSSLDEYSFEMADVIEKLPKHQQELIYLKYFQQLKNDEIAHIQQIPEGTVKSRLHTTLKKLRVLMGKGEL